MVKGKRGGFLESYSGWIILGAIAAIFIIGGILYHYLKPEGYSLIAQIKNIFNFGSYG